MTVTITAYDWVPDFAKGHVRDFRVRWALEEAGESYDVRYLSQGEQKQPEHRALQPFGQVPTLEEDEVRLFESGAIVLYIAETRGVLIPKDSAGRATAMEWLFAALNTLEPRLMDRALTAIFEKDQPWSEQRLPLVEKRIRERLGDVSKRLGDRQWLGGDEFTVGDLMVASVLREVEDSPLLAEWPNLVAYHKRALARPAFQRALAGQMAGFTGSPPAGFGG